MRKTSRLKDLLAFMPLVPVFFLIAHVSTLEKALVSVVVLYTFYVLISEKWNNRKNAAFWILIALFCIIHVVVIYNLNIEGKISPAMICLPFAIVDFFVMYYIIGLYEKALIDRDATSQFRH